MAQVYLETTMTGVAVLGINRPEALNALSRTIIDEMDALVTEIEGREDIRVLILYSRGNFAAGADIKNMVNLSPDEARSFSFVHVMNRIRKLQIPTIAAIEGYALGGGLELALTCDLRLASKSATLGFPEINLGIMPGAGGTIAVPRLIGEAKAKELIFTGRSLHGEEAERIGLVNQSVEDDKLFEEAKKLAEKLAGKAPVALRTAKQSVAAGLEAADMDAGLEAELALWSGLFSTEDQKEGMNAFIEKRKPAYKGK